MGLLLPCSVLFVLKTRMNKLVRNLTDIVHLQLINALKVGGPFTGETGLIGGSACSRTW